MKTLHSSGRKLTVILLSLLVAAVVWAGCDKDDYNDDNRVYSISGNASGAQMVPTVSGSGTGTITGTYDPNTGLLSYTTNWNNLSGTPTTGNLYYGSTGSAGTAVGTPWVFPSTATGTGMYSGTITLNAEQADQLLNNNWYYSYGTTLNPTGEIRGQITATR